MKVQPVEQNSHFLKQGVYFFIKHPAFTSPQLYLVNPVDTRNRLYNALVDLISRGFDITVITWTFKGNPFGKALWERLRARRVSFNLSLME
jgi:hypothetical protein